MALETWNGVGKVTTSPFWPCFRGRLCFLRSATPSTKIFSDLGKTPRTLPCLPRSFPEIIIILSPFFIFIYLYNFFRQGNYFIKTFFFYFFIKTKKTPGGLPKTLM